MLCFFTNSAFNWEQSPFASASHLQFWVLKCLNHLKPCTSSSVTETTSTSSELLEGESSVRGMLDQLNSGMFLNCNVNVNVNCKEWLFLSWKSINICSSTAFFWKLISKHTCLDILTRVFGYLITRVWICSLPGIKGHPCDPNEATQLVNDLMHYKWVWENIFAHSWNVFKHWKTNFLSLRSHIISSISYSRFLSSSKFYNLIGQSGEFVN